MKLQQQPEDDFQLPEKITDLDDLAQTLWMQYFKPAEPLPPTVKRELRDRYNLVADKINKLSGFNRVIKLTPSTLWIASKSAEDPTSNLKRMPVQPTTGQIKQRSVPAPSFKQLAKSKPVKEPGKGGGIIDQIIAHHVSGLSNKEIIALGFNKSTVARQVGEYKKRQTNK